MRSARGRRLGTVEALELERETSAAAVVLVRRRGRQSVLHVRPEWISLVDPWERCLVVRRPRRRIAPAWPAPAARSVVRGGRATGAGARKAAHATARVAPPAGRAVHVFGRRAALAVSFVAWLYAAVVFAMARLVVRLAVLTAIAVVRSIAWLAPRLRRIAAAIQSHLARETPGRPPLRT